jgi:membrane-associated phospholipid phosphatase
MIDITAAVQARWWIQAKSDCRLHGAAATVTGRRVMPVLTRGRIAADEPYQPRAQERASTSRPRNTRCARRAAAASAPKVSRPAMSNRHGDQELAQRLPGRLRVARLVGEVLSPPPILVALALIVAWDSSPTPAMAVVWGTIAAVFASVLPYALILRGVRRGRLSDKNISVRAQRIRFGVVAITSILLGLAVLAAFDAPAELVALLASIAVGVACGWMVTLWWKISVHAAIAAGAATVLVFVFGPALLAVWPLVALIAWSRVQVGDHTPAQVLAGVALGVVVNATVFPLLR